jgi:spermidine dehydrogenase
MSRNPSVINRRDFVNGCAMSLAAGTTLSPFDVIAGQMALPGAMPAGYYPPTRLGLRGSHEGSFEVAHDMLRGRTWDVLDTGERVYDLVVVGAGLSGLAAAWFYRRRHGPDAKILILDNHDDFGGHAKRNEFWHDGKMYLVNGGTLNVEAPSQYSAVASDLLQELGIDRTRYFEKNRAMWSRYGDMGLQSSLFFDREHFGVDKLVAGWGDIPIRDFVQQAPLADEVRRDVIKLYESQEDYLAELSTAEKIAKLKHVSYRNYIVDIAGCHPDVVKLFDTSLLGIFVTGMDAIPAAYCQEMGYPGFAGLGLPEIPADRLAGEAGGQHGRENSRRAEEGDPDMYFPDGNATIARMLVASLIPGAVSAAAMEDIVTAKVDYQQLDQPDNNVRIRLNSTVINAGNVANDQVDTRFVTGGKGYAVRSRNAVLACWHSVIPTICPEVPQAQKDALGYGVKSPLVYSGVLISNWQSFVDAGVSQVSVPEGYFPSIGLPPSLEIGAYETSRDPAKPIVLRMSCYFRKPGLSRRDQHRAGMAELLQTPFATFEHHIRDQLTRIFGPTGFDDERDILGIAVNRWPHGYTYSYNPLFDPEDWAYTTTADRPAIVGRQPVGRITIANADAAASPHTDAAIDEAYRAVSELSI